MALTTLHRSRSSWVQAIGYQNGYLAVFTKEGWAWLFEGVPATLPGLISAGRVTEKSGDLSVGSAVHRLALSQKYTRQHVADREAVRELKRMMKEGRSQ